MKMIEFENYEHFSDFLYYAVDNNCVACVVLPYDKTCQLLRELLLLDDVKVGSIRLENEDYSGYDREYYVTLDTDLIIDISPAWLRCENEPGHYLYQDADFYMFDGDVHSSILKEYSNSPCYEICINEDYDSVADGTCEMNDDNLSQIAGLFGLLF